MSLILSGTDGLSEVDGSAATPAIRGTDANTGIFFPAADTIGFAEGGAEVARFDSAGNLGIGTSSPSSVLNVKSSAPVFRLETTGDVTSSGTASYAIKDSSGNDVFTNGFLGLANCYQFTTTFANGFMRFLTGSQVEAMRIDSSGNLLVGVTSTIGGLTAFGHFANVNAGAAGIVVGNAGGTSTTNTILFTNSNGIVGGISTSGSATSFNTSSDYRLKNTIAPMTGALDKVALLKPCTYKWNVDGSDGQGFIAHELQEVIAGCVTGEKDAVETYTDEDGNEATRPVHQGIDTSFLVATLTAAIQEQQALITALTARITALETQSADNPPQGETP
jgi:hypothetical protein